MKRFQRVCLPLSWAGTRVRGPCPGGWLQKILVCPEACSLFWAALSLACFWYSRWRLEQVWHRVSAGMGGAPHSTQMPRSLALSLLSWVLRRINSLRSGVWARWRSYSRRFSCLASSSAGVGSTRGFGVLGWGVAFFRLVVFCLALGFLVVALRGVVDFLGLTRRLGSSNGKLSTNICLLEGIVRGFYPCAWNCAKLDFYAGRILHSFAPGAGLGPASFSRKMFLIPMYGSWEDLPGFPLLVYRVPWIGLAGVWRPGPDGVLNQARRGAVGPFP